MLVVFYNQSDMKQELRLELEADEVTGLLNSDSFVIEEFRKHGEDTDLYKVVNSIFKYDEGGARLLVTYQIVKYSPVVTL